MQGRGILEACGGYKACDLVEGGGDKVELYVQGVVCLIFDYNEISCYIPGSRQQSTPQNHSFFNNLGNQAGAGSDKAGPRPVDEMIQLRCLISLASEGNA